MPVRRTSPSTRHDETTVNVPRGDGDSDRDAAHSRSYWLSSRSSTTASTRLHCRPTVPVPRSSRGPFGNLQPRSGCLSSRSRRQRRHVSNAGPGSGSSRRPIGSHSCCCLRRRPRCQPTYPGSRIVRRANAAHCVYLQQSLEPQFPATSGGSTHRAKLSFASHGLSDLALSHLAPAVEPTLNSNFTSARLSTTLPVPVPVP